VSLVVKPITFSVANVGAALVVVTPQNNQYFVGQALTLSAVPRNTNGRSLSAGPTVTPTPTRTITVGLSQCLHRHLYECRGAGRNCLSHSGSGRSAGTITEYAQAAVATPDGGVPCGWNVLLESFQQPMATGPARYLGNCLPPITGSSNWTPEGAFNGIAHLVQRAGLPLRHLCDSGRRLHPGGREWFGFQTGTRPARATEGLIAGS